METQPEQANSASSQASNHTTSDVPATKPAATQPEQSNSASSQQTTSDLPATTPTRKHPGRVAAEIDRTQQTSWLSKKKKAEVAATDTPTAPDTTASQTTPDSNISSYYSFGIGSLIVSALGVYYQREAILNAIGRNQQRNNTSTPPSPITSQQAPKIRHME